MRKVVRQDVANVCRSQGSRNFERKHPDDSKSVDLWVQDLKARSSVLMYTRASDIEKLFLLVMDRHQVELARQHVNGHVIRFVTFPIYLQRQYHLIALTTFSRKDSKAHLLAYALTEQDDEDILQLIISAVQTKTGLLQPEIIFADDPSAVKRAWSSCWPEEAACHPRSDPIFLIPSWKVIYLCILILLCLDYFNSFYSLFYVFREN